MTTGHEDAALLESLNNQIQEKLRRCNHVSWVFDILVFCSVTVNLALFLIANLVSSIASGALNPLSVVLAIFGFMFTLFVWIFATHFRFSKKLTLYF
ncbi:MAG: hypothetical protein R3F50_17210 [Gammaproteobacteria bacterium]